MVWLLNSQGTKHCKSTESFCLSTLFTWMIGPLTTWCLLLPCPFFLTRFLNMCKPRTASYLLWQVSPPRLTFYGSGPAHVSNWLGMMNAGWLSSMLPEMLLQMELIIFKDVPPNRLTFYMGSLPHIIIRSLFSHFCLFQNAVLLKVLKLEFLNFKPVFLRMRF